MYVGTTIVPSLFFQLIWTLQGIWQVYDVVPLGVTVTNPMVMVWLVIVWLAL